MKGAYGVLARRLLESGLWWICVSGRVWDAKIPKLTDRHHGKTADEVSETDRHQPIIRADKAHVVRDVVGRVVGDVRAPGIAERHLVTRGINRDDRVDMAAAATNEGR